MIYQLYALQITRTDNLGLIDATFLVCDCQNVTQTARLFPEIIGNGFHIRKADELIDKTSQYLGISIFLKISMYI